MGLWQGLIKGLLDRTGGERHPDRVIRHVMYERLAAVVPSAGPTPRVLAVGRSGSLATRLGLDGGEVVDVDFPEHDLTNLAKFADGEFDALVADQVLEHVAGSPFHAAAESLRVVRPGGVIVHTTCLINPIHGAPHDFWRFTPHGLELLFGDAEIVDVGGWGNRQVWRYLAGLGMRYPRVPAARWHPLHRAAFHSDPAWPIVTWVVARKPAPYPSS